MYFAVVYEGFFFWLLLNLFTLLTYVYMEVDVFQYICPLFAWKCVNLLQPSGFCTSSKIQYDVHTA